VANIKSSKKDIRRTKRRKILNSQHRTRLRTFDKKIHKLVEEGNLTEAVAAFREYSSLLDRAGKKNLIHHRQADRRKSRISLFLNHVSASAPASAAHTAPEASEQAQPET
jgi:small subunit ribosomal protein S20